MKAKILSWKECQPSQAGKVILIQLILQLIPLYFMGFFFAKNFCHELNMVMASFCWGSTKDKHKIHWKSGDSLVCQKWMEDLDFGIQFVFFNLAMLANQW